MIERKTDKKQNKKTETKSTLKKVSANAKRLPKKSTVRKKTRASNKKSLRILPVMAGVAVGGAFMFLVMAFVVPLMRDVAETFYAGKEARRTAQKVAEKTVAPNAVTPPQTPQPEPSRQSASTQTQVSHVAEQPKTPAQTAAPKTEKQSAQTAPQIASAKPDVQKQPEIQTQDSHLAATIPVAAKGAKLVFVFDDGGQNMSQLESFVKLPFPITVAVLPRLAHSAETARRVRSSGNEVMLHQPMQAINTKINPGDGAILPEMTAEEISATMNVNIAEIAPIAGVNNHEGSLISEDEFKMMAVLETTKQNGIFYLDSRTTSQTRVPQAAMEVGVGYYERNVFLDNTKKREDILAEIRRGLDVANKKGTAIMIGHIWSSDVLPAILHELYPILQNKGYTFSTVSKSGAMIKP